MPNANVRKCALMQSRDDRCTYVLIGREWGRQIRNNAHICTLPHIALDPAQDIHVSISPTMDISSRLELYVQPDGHIWTWLKTHIPPGLARTQYPAVRPYQSHMTPISSLVAESIHCRIRESTSVHFRALMPVDFMECTL